MLVLAHLSGQLSPNLLIPHCTSNVFSFLLFFFFSFVGVGAMTWSPLACGIISGKYGNGVPESSRASLKVFASTSRQESGEGKMKGGSLLKVVLQHPQVSQPGHAVTLTSWWPMASFSWALTRSLPQLLARLQPALPHWPAQKILLLWGGGGRIQCPG